MTRSGGRSRPSDKELVARYVAARRALKERGIIRGDRSLAGEYAEYLAERFLGIELERDLVTADFDGTRNGLRYQIKGRTLPRPNTPTSWDFSKRPDGFDILLAFAFDPDYELRRVVSVPLEVVQELAHETANRWSFRWNRKTASHPGVTEIDLARFTE